MAIVDVKASDKMKIPPDVDVADTTIMLDQNGSITKSKGFRSALPEVFYKLGRFDELLEDYDVNDLPSRAKAQE
jgi:hypothetical protein